MITVYSDNQFKIIWNESATFNVYMNDIEVDCFTCYDVDLEQAIELAKEHIQFDILGEG